MHGTVTMFFVDGSNVQRWVDLTYVDDTHIDVEGSSSSSGWVIEVHGITKLDEYTS